jgi:prophage regulatory protein
MQAAKPNRLISGRDVRSRLAIRSANTVRDHVRRGVLTPPIKLSQGPTTPSVWPEREIDAIIEARIAGKSDEDLRSLVARLAAERQAAA